MKVLSKNTDCYFIRNDLSNAIEAKLNLPQYTIDQISQNFFEIYADCVINQNATIIMMSVFEQIKVLKHFLSENHFKDILNLDKFNHIFNYNLDTSRLFVKGINCFENTNDLKINGIDHLFQTFHNQVEKLLIIDDDICTGNTIKQIIETLDKFNLFPKANIFTLGLANYCAQHYNIIDCIDIRDFFYGTLFGGIVTQQGNTLSRVCYLDESIDLTKMANIHPSKCNIFRSEILKLQFSMSKRVHNHVSKSY
ncbi:MAG: hypothetical protein KDH96_01600 [Candidatus Riesia sp.]|nr:hypothetical protein [Candidatus Riesia sp.]